MTTTPHARYSILVVGCATAVLVSAIGCPSHPPSNQGDSPAAVTRSGTSATADTSESTTESPAATQSSDGVTPPADGDGPGRTAVAGPDDRDPSTPGDAVARVNGRTAQSIDPAAAAHEEVQGSTDEADRPCDGWPQPDLALFITGRQNGYIEPCGCSGFVNAKGGLTRRFALLAELKERGWNVLAIDVGNQVDRFGRQAELKFQTTVDVLKKMQYDAVGLGPDDLRLSFGELYAAIADLEDQEGPFVCANVTLFDIPRPYRLFETDLGKVGITAVLGKAEQEKVGSIGEIEFREPAGALRQVVDEMKKQSCDIFVLLAHTSIKDSKELARQIPEIDLVVTAGGAGEPPRQPETIDGSKARLIQVGTKGMFAGVVGLYCDENTPPRYERVMLNHRLKDSPEVLEIFADYQNTLKELRLDGLGLGPVGHPSGRFFVGSEACRECHETAYEIFKNTPHFDATTTLVKPTERSEIPRHFDPECLSCHVTGWNPQGYFPYQSGYLDLHESAHLHSTGCESCHGPGSDHVTAENGESKVTDEEIEKLRQQMILTLEEARNTKCYECHDLDNSPAFQKEGAFDEYWEQVKHEEKY